MKKIPGRKTIALEITAEGWKRFKSVRNVAYPQSGAHYGMESAWIMWSSCPFLLL